MSNTPHISNYTRLFRVQGLRYLIDDIWIDHYKNLHAVVTVRDGVYISYIPKEIHTLTLQEGVALFGNIEAYSAFKIEFFHYMDTTQALLSHYLEAERLTPHNLLICLDAIARLFYYYSKTEFIYTDDAYRVSLESGQEVLAQNLVDWGNVKYMGREFLNSVFFGEKAFLPRLIQKVSDQTSVPVEDIHQYSRAELAALLTGTVLDQGIIAARNKAFVLKGAGQDFEVILDEDAVSFIEDFTRVDNIAVEEYRGTIASKGKATGSARIILSGFDNFDQLGQMMDEMQQGDILIAETTSPELMPACKKAGAILTDQGGLMSHAAIVSRELGIPCIVGMGDISAHVLNGDLLEVNADEGVVRILGTTS